MLSSDMNTLNARHDHSLSPESIKLNEDESFVRKIQEMCKKAGFHHTSVKRVYDAVDHDRDGHSSIEALAKAALVIKEDLSKVEIFGCATALRDIRRACRHLNEKLMTCHRACQAVLVDMEATIHRKQYAPNNRELCSTNQWVEGLADASSLSPEAERALEELGSYIDGGVMPRLKHTGKLKVRAGTGHISIVADEVQGAATNFRAEVNPGDIIIAEAVVSDRSSGHKITKSWAFTVATVVSNMLMTVTLEPLDSIPSSLEFKVVKSVAEKKASEVAEWQQHVSSLAMSQPAMLSPRSSQSLFEWQVAGKRDNIVEVSVVEKEYMELQTQFERLEHELIFAVERELLATCFAILKNRNPEPGLFSFFFS